jgi:hypothetical protein
MVKTVNEPVDKSILDLRDAVHDFKDAVNVVRDGARALVATPAAVILPPEASGWNFTTFEKYINQRFIDIALQLRERYEAQQTGVTAALAAAEKAVNAALIAAEKAVDKAEGAQQLRNEAQNEFRKSLSDLSGLMWSIKEGTLAVDSLRRELTAMLGEEVRRVGILETGYANIQGRIWAVSALFAVGALILDISSRFFVHYN